MISLPDGLAAENWLPNALRESSTAAGEGPAYLHPCRLAGGENRSAYTPCSARQVQTMIGLGAKVRPPETAFPPESNKVFPARPRNCRLQQGSRTVTCGGAAKAFEGSGRTHYLQRRWIERSSRWPACIQHISIGVVKGVRARFLYCRLCERGQFTADCQERDRSDNSKHCHLMFLLRPFPEYRALSSRLDQSCRLLTESAPFHLHSDLKATRFVTNHPGKGPRRSRSASTIQTSVVAWFCKFT
jgi:hypothetical protein